MRKPEQKRTRWLVACVVLAIGLWSGSRGALAQEKGTGANVEEDRPVAESGAETPAIDFEALQAEYEARQKAMLKKLRADPDWQGTHEEVSVIEPVSDFGPNAIHNFCLNLDGNLLVCCGGDRETYVRDPKNPRGYTVEKVAEPSEIRVVRPDGQLVAKWKLDSQPQAICVHRDGTIFVAGDGRVLKLSGEGKVLAAVDSPAVAGPAKPEAVEPEGDAAEEEKTVAPSEQTESKSLLQVLIDAIVGAEPAEAELSEEQKKAMEKMLKRRRREVTGIAVTDQDVFVACPARQGFGYCVWRMDHDLQNAEQIVDGLRGCCSQMDIQAKDGELWVPENGCHRVLRYDRDGKQLASFGKRGRKKPSEFGGCCEPKNLRFGPDGSLYLSESGPPMVVKRFSPDGEFQGVVGMPSFQTGCVRVTVEVSSDGDRVYVLNTDGNKIHVLADKRRLPTHEQVATIKIPGEIKPEMLHTFCLDPKGNLLIATGGERVTYTMGPNGREAKLVSEKKAILAISPDGKPLTTWDLDITPQAFDVAEDGTVFVGGEGRLARLGTDGKVQKVADSPHVAGLPPLPPEPEKTAKPEEETEEEKARKQAEVAKLQEKLKSAMEVLRTASEEYRANRTDKDAQQKYQDAMNAYIKVSQELRDLTTTPEVLAAQRRAAAMRKRMVRSIAVTGDDVFVCCPAAKGYGFDVWRTDRDFGSGKKIVTGLRGCCGNMYIQAHEGKLWVAENARKRVVGYDRDGKELAVWGSSDRKAIEGFGSCCNPMCIRFGPDGVVYTAESNLGRIKRFSPDGKFLGLVGTVKIVPGCKHVPIGITADASRVYMLDLTRSHVIVMEPVGPQPATEADAAECKLAAGPLAMLTDREGSTTLTGLFVVPTSDPVRTIADLAGYRIIFGPPDSAEKHSAALAALKKSGVAVPEKPETAPACTDAAIAALENKQKPGAAAVISSYAMALLEGCGTVEKGSLRVIGRTGRVPFITVFATPSVDAEARQEILGALSAAAEVPELLVAMETKLGFVAIEQEPAAAPKAADSSARDSTISTGRARSLHSRLRCTKTWQRNVESLVPRSSSQGAGNPARNRARFGVLRKQPLKGSSEREPVMIKPLAEARVSPHNGVAPVEEDHNACGNSLSR